MFRTQVYLTDEEKHGLESVALAQGVSQSDLIRQAVDQLLATAANASKGPVLDGIAGIWADHTDIPDIRELRTGWRQRSAR